jgi:hypothetical protein
MGNGDAVSRLFRQPKRAVWRSVSAWGKVEAVKGGIRGGFELKNGAAAG